jgi:ABC-type lipopolysaccharide export system ATPase subunit
MYPARAQLRHQLPAPGAVGLPQAHGGGEHPGGAGSAAAGQPERRTRAERLINQLNLGHIRTTRGYALSGGERRRVEIARALCIQPNFILLDEPFSGIDPIAVLELQKIIFDLKASGASAC